MERQNRTIQRSLVKLLSEEHQKDWRKALPGVIFAFNTAKHASTQFSPFFLLHGWKPRQLVDVVHDEVEENLVDLYMDCDTDGNSKFIDGVREHVSRLKRVHDEVCCCY